MLPYTEEEQELKLTRSARQTGEFCMDWKLAKGMDRYSDCTNHKTMASCKNLIMRVANWQLQILGRGILFPSKHFTSRMISSNAHKCN